VQLQFINQAKFDTYSSETNSVQQLDQSYRKEFKLQTQTDSNNGQCLGVPNSPQSTGRHGSPLDCYWNITSYPPSGSNFGRAYNVTSINYRWTDTYTWVAPEAMENNIENSVNDPVGSYTYQTYFNLDFPDYRCLSLPIEYSADDYVQSITLNGVDLSSFCNSDQGTCDVQYSYIFSYVFAGNFMNKNILQIVTYNDDGPSGLFVSFHPFQGCNCPAGEYNIGTGPCTACPAGQYSLGSTGGCTNVNAGK
jgi:hypothetical protein